MNWPNFMCLTTDGLERSHSEQVQALCSAGVDWVQLRSKTLSDAALEPIAFECLIRCREVGASFVLNDRLELALKIGADGVHLGKQDTPWEAARERAGEEFIIGGTINSLPMPSRQLRPACSITSAWAVQVYADEAEPCAGPDGCGLGIVDLPGRAAELCNRRY